MKTLTVSMILFCLATFVVVAILAIRALWQMSNHNVPLVLFVGTGCVMFLGFITAYLRDGGWK